MVNTNQIAEIGLLVGEPARAAMLAALMDGRALTASELAYCAGITPQTASSHLARLAGANLLKMEKQGRHRYHRLATPEVARLLESLMEIAAKGTPSTRRVATGPRDAAMRRARTCYDHFAGRLGVAITDGLITSDLIAFDDEAGLITERGLDFLARHEISLDATTASGRASVRPLCRPCLDWSERRPHVAGKLGAAICRHFFDRKLVHRLKGTRAIEVTPKGQQVLRDMFGVRETI